MPLTIETIKAYGATGNDIVIQAKIDAFASTYACLSSSYDQAVADDIANSYLAGQLIAASGEGQVTSRKAPNGASRSFKSASYGDAGDFDNALIRQALNADVNGCIKPDDSVFAIGSAGTKYAADNPYEH